jgi:metal-responsive CopG/Arc/MetJ family transcriptional regulator
MEKLDQITIHLTPGFAKKIDEMAERLRVSRSTLVRNLLETAYEDARVMESTGMLAAVQFGQKLISKIKEGIASGKITFDEDGELEIKRKKKK